MHLHRQKVYGKSLYLLFNFAVNLHCLRKVHKKTKPKQKTLMKTSLSLSIILISVSTHSDTLFL